MAGAGAGLGGFHQREAVPVCRDSYVRKELYIGSGKAAGRDVAFERPALYRPGCAVPDPEGERGHPVRIPGAEKAEIAPEMHGLHYETGIPDGGKGAGKEVWEKAGSERPDGKPEPGVRLRDRGDKGLPVGRRILCTGR